MVVPLSAFDRSKGGSINLIGVVLAAEGPGSTIGTTKDILKGNLSRDKFV